MSIVAIDIQKLYAETKAGKSCTCMMFIDLEMVVDNRIKIPGIHFQDQNMNNNLRFSEQQSNNVV
jgi:hypothetical protein